MFTGRSLFNSAFPAAPTTASIAPGQGSDDAQFDRIIADLIARRGSKPLAIIDLAYGLIADIASDQDVDDATANRRIAQLWELIAWADKRCEDTLDRLEVLHEVKPGILFRAGLAPAIAGGVNTIPALPPLPTPGMPDCEIAAALTAWSGDPAQVIASLAVELDSEIGLDVSVQQHERLSPRLDRLVEWAATRHRERPLRALREYHAHKAAIQAAIDRYGY